MTDLSPEIRAFYEQGLEAGRLIDGSQGGPLEFDRTVELLERYLEPGPLRVLDVGGGPGAYAAWLRDRGHEVVLVDPVPLHVEQARARGLDAELGDARGLNHADEAFDVVLVMGPLYHLTSEAERARALAEARRVLRPGGRVFATAISRFAALLDLLVRLDRLHEPAIFDCVEEAVTTGVFRGDEHTGLFTTAYFHLPDELSAELAGAGFASCEVLNVEGPGFLVRDLDSRWADSARREVMLRAARLIESRPEMLAAASHLMAVAKRPSTQSPGDRQ